SIRDVGDAKSFERFEGRAIFLERVCLRGNVRRAAARILRLRRERERADSDGNEKRENVGAESSVHVNSPRARSALFLEAHCRPHHECTVNCELPTPAVAEGWGEKTRARRRPSS